jgi:hypothetical protein
VTDIDWDQALKDAEDSPRGLLAEVLALADEIKNIVIVVRDNDGQANCWLHTESGYHAVAMLEYAKWYELQKVHDRAME